MKVLTKDGWYIDRVRGSHHILKHPTKNGRVTIALHKEDLKLKLDRIVKIEFLH